MQERELPKGLLPPLLFPGLLRVCPVNPERRVLCRLHRPLRANERPNSAVGPRFASIPCSKRIAP
jgi:hypothetical protein